MQRLRKSGKITRALRNQGKQLTKQSNSYCQAPKQKEITAGHRRSFPLHRRPHWFGGGAGSVVGGSRRLPLLEGQTPRAGLQDLERRLTGFPVSGPLTLSVKDLTEAALLLRQSSTWGHAVEELTFRSNLFSSRTSEQLANQKLIEQERETEAAALRDSEEPIYKSFGAPKRCGRAWQESRPSYKQTQRSMATSTSLRNQAGAGWSVSGLP